MKVEDLDVFKLAHELTIEIYSITEMFPENERYGLTSQMRRAAMSIGSNLMEGSHRFSKKSTGTLSVFLGAQPVSSSISFCYPGTYPT